VLGLVYAPAIGRLFGGARGAGAWLEDAHGRRSIACRPVPAEGLTVVASRSHGDETALDAFLAGRKVASRTNAGSSLKLCLVAAGEADLYPRLGRTMEWDIAAGDAVLRAAGGKVTVVADGQPLRYGKPGFDNPTSRPPVSDTSPPSHARAPASDEVRPAVLRRLAWAGVGRIATLPALLDGWRLVPAARARAEGAQAVLAWGASPAPGAPRPGRPARVCRCCGWRMASCARWAWGRRAALVHRAGRPGHLLRRPWALAPGTLVRQPLNEARRSRADDLCRAWRAARVSKYNHAREWAGAMAPGDVLVVDQTAGDASIAGAMADARSFQRMLEAALDEHPRPGSGSRSTRTWWPAASAGISGR
jgi:hypothetical protein